MILSSAVMVSVSFLALAVGMKMRSSKAVIVTSVSMTPVKMIYVIWTKSATETSSIPFS